MTMEDSFESAEEMPNQERENPGDIPSTVQATRLAETLPSMEELLEDETYAPLRRGDIRKGVVLSVTPNFVVMDIRAKREGFVPKRDLDRLDREVREQITVGTEFPVYVLNPEDAEGRTIVSISRGLVQIDWDRAVSFLESQEIWEGRVSGHNRGGLLVSFGRLRGFVPSSHLVGFPRSLPPEEKRQRLIEMLDQTLGLRVIEVDQRRNRLILSERAAYREWREQQQERFLTELREGQILSGKVSSLQDFGVFVDLGGIDGLVHISELSWKRVGHPSEVIQVGDEVQVMVLRVDRQRKRISLSIRRTQKDPWKKIEERYTLGQIITGRISRIVTYGAFVEVEEQIEGLVHISELSNDRVGHPGEVIEEGEVLPLRVIRIDAARRRLGLSAQRVTAQEWEEWRAQRLHTAGSELEALDPTSPAAEERPTAAATAEVAAAEPPAAEERPTAAATAEVAAAEPPAAEETSAEDGTGDENLPASSEAAVLEEPPEETPSSAETAPAPTMDVEIETADLHAEEAVAIPEKVAEETDG